MSTFPLIGVSMSITVTTSPERAYVNSTYLNAIQQAGGVPVALPAQLSPRSWERLAAGLDGLLLTGGGDIDPALFGEAPSPTLYDVAPIRDTFETAAARWALERGVPLLCICRGLQVLNVALGGSLHQDVATEPGTQLEHSQKGPRDEPTHKVTVTPGSRLAEVLGAKAPAGTHERRFSIQENGSATLRGIGGDVAWSFTAIPDRAPSIALTKDPEPQARGSLGGSSPPL